jgi:hypothetical protein
MDEFDFLTVGAFIILIVAAMMMAATSVAFFMEQLTT